MARWRCSAACRAGLGGSFSEVTIPRVWPHVEQCVVDADQYVLDECWVLSVTWPQVNVSRQVSSSAGFGWSALAKIDRMASICFSLSGGGGQQNPQWVVREPATDQRIAWHSAWRCWKSA